MICARVNARVLMDREMLRIWLCLDRMGKSKQKSGEETDEEDPRSTSAEK